MPNPDALHVVVDDLSRFRRSEATVDTEHLLTIEFFELTRSRIRAGVVLYLNLITLPGVRQFRKRVDCAAKRVRPLRHPESHPRKGRVGFRPEAEGPTSCTAAREPTSTATGRSTRQRPEGQDRSQAALVDCRPPSTRRRASLRSFSSGAEVGLYKVVATATPCSDAPTSHPCSFSGERSPSGVGRPNPPGCVWRQSCAESSRQPARRRVRPRESVTPSGRDGRRESVSACECSPRAYPCRTRWSTSRTPPAAARCGRSRW